MKTSAILLAALLLAGCAGIPDLNCENARKVYTAYLASMLVRDVSDAEIEDAKAAGTFLSIGCGWTAPDMPAGAKARVQVLDRNGVPILKAP